MATAVSPARRALVIVLSVVMVTTMFPADIVPTGVDNVSAQTGTDTECSEPGVDDKCEAWVSAEPESDASYFTQADVSPDSQQVYHLRNYPPGIWALDAEDGETLWSHEGPKHLETFREIKITPDGEELLVTGQGHIRGDGQFQRYLPGEDDPEGIDDVYRLSSFDAQTGERLWTTTTTVHGDPLYSEIGPRGERIFVSGTTTTMAFSVDSGEHLWGLDDPSVRGELLPSPDGESLFIVEQDSGSNRFWSLDAATGEIRWEATVPDAGSYLNDQALSPDGETLFVTGTASLSDHAYPPYIAALDTNDGQLLWEHRLGTGETLSVGDWIWGGALAVGPDSGTVYVAAGALESRAGSSSMAVTAIDASTGQERWVHWEPGEHNNWDAGPGLAVHPDGSRLYVQAEHDPGVLQPRGVTTFALEAASGERVWTAEVDDGSSTRYIPTMAPDGSHVYIPTWNGQVLAYETGGPDAAPTDESDETGDELDLTTVDDSTAHQEANRQLSLDLSAAIDAGSTPREGLVHAARQALDQRATLAEEHDFDGQGSASFQHQQANLNTSEIVLDIANDPHLTPVEKALEIADAGAKQAESPSQARVQDDLEATTQLLDTMDGSHGSELAESIAIAKQASRHQAESNNLTWTAPPEGPDHDAPSEAARTLADRYNLTLTAEQEADIQELDALPEPTRTELTDLIDAFLTYDAVIEDAYADANLTAIAAAREGTSEIKTLQEAGVNLSLALPARNELLDAGVALDRAIEQTGPITSTDSDPAVALPPALAIDLTDADHTYTKDYALLVDALGDDRYANNAGGSGLMRDHAGDCRATIEQPTEIDPETPAAALFDLGLGDDDYTTQGRNCGVRGGGHLGAGLLVDGGGEDEFTAYRPEAYTDPSDIVDPVATDTASTSRTQRDALEASNETATGTTATGTEAPPSYVVGLEHKPQRSVGDTFYNATVTDVSHALAFLVVEPVDEDGFLANASSDPDVRYVEENARFEVTGSPSNDPYVTEQYGIEHINAPEAWKTSQGDASKGICVADSGVDYTHPDLNGTRYLGGYEFWSDIRYERDDPYPFNKDGHGTLTTGIAAATIGNEEGIAGTANVGFLASKVLEYEFGFASYIAEGIRWCADNGGDVISISFGGSDVSVVEDAIEYAHDQGSLIIASSGDLGRFDGVLYPAAYEEVVAVTCTNETGESCLWANTGPEAEIAAPGMEILSTGIGAGYERWSGSSMSVPFVSGTAALVWSQVPELTADELRQLLRDQARDAGSPGCDERYGHGIVDANATLNAAVDGARPAYEGPTECLATGSIGTNGGGHLGTGLLVAAGSQRDTFTAGMMGTNGGGNFGGLGGLVTGHGSTTYEALNRGTNGGAAASVPSSLGGPNLGVDFFIGGLTGGAYTDYARLPGSGFLIDQGGNDAYTATRMGTNGGGTSDSKGFLLDTGDGADVYSATLGGINGGGHSGTGFLADIGLGNDTYRGLHGLGANGGTSGTATAALVDTGGNDTYLAGDGGTNGGSRGEGSALLVDVGGSDLHSAGSWGTNGGAAYEGAPGFLVNVNGHDRYESGSQGTNGGAYGNGQGFLLDTGGANSYTAESWATNGGTATGEGTGFLFDASTDDTTYVADGKGTNGGSRTLFDGIGILLDAGGSDSYQATGQGTNGGAMMGGYGFLLDPSGRDDYRATWGGTNGGAGEAGGYTSTASPGSVGLLFDGEGNDRYEATSAGTNGGGWRVNATGSLIDLAGDDIYRATTHGTNGGGAGGAGFLADHAGNDTYIAGDYGTNGGGFLSRFTEATAMDGFVGSGFLLDLAGNDVYTAGMCGANGAGAEHCPHIQMDGELSVNALGRLADLEGCDTYRDDNANASGRDISVVPKGTIGAQADEDACPFAQASADRATTTRVTPVHFTDESYDRDGEIVDWQWTFGDGTTSSTQNPTHTYDTLGTHEATLTVTDDRGNTNTTTVATIDVTNEAPTLEQIPNQATRERDPVSFDVAANDLEDDAITLSAAPLPEGASFTDADNGTGHFAWTPEMGQTGTYNVTVTATDAFGDASQQTVHISVGMFNQPPVIEAPLSVETREGGEVSVTAVASDDDGPEPVEWQVDTDPPVGSTSVTESGNGSVTWTWSVPEEQRFGTTVTFRADDGLDVGYATTNVSVLRSPDIDVLSPVEEVTGMATDTLIAGETVTLQAEASDPDGNVSKVRFHPDGLDSEARTATADEDGVYETQVTYTSPTDAEILVEAVDDDGLVNRAARSAEVVVNSDPVVEPIEAPTVNATGTNASREVTLEASAEDPEGRPLVEGGYTWTLPATAVNGTASATRTGTQLTHSFPVGVHSVDLSVADPNGGETTETIPVTVDDALEMDVQIFHPDDMGPTDQALLGVLVLRDDGRPLADGTVDLSVTHVPSDVTTVEETAHLSDEGLALVRIPYDVDVGTPQGLNLLGEHEVSVDVEASSRAGAPIDDTERATEMGSFTVSQ